MVLRDTKTAAQLLYEERIMVEQDALLTVLKTWEGRRVLYNVLAKGDIYEQNGPTPFGDEGQRATGKREMSLEVLREALTLQPDAYILMQKEAGDFEKKYAVNLGSEGEEDATD